MITCPACGKENEDSAFECKRCRAPLRDEIPEEQPAQEAAPESSESLGEVCRRCETYNEPGVRICTNCGFELFAEALAAVAPMDRTPPPTPPSDATPPDGNPSITAEMRALALSDDEAAEAGVSRGNGEEAPPMDKTPSEPYAPPHLEPEPAPSRAKEMAAAAATAAGAVVGAAVGIAARGRTPEPPPPPPAPARRPEAAPPAEKICSNCGAANPPAAKFCFDCGTPFAKKPVPPPEPPKAEPPPKPPEPQRAPPPKLAQPVRAAPPPPPPPRIEPLKPLTARPPTIEISPSIQVDAELAEAIEATAESAPVSLDEPLPEEQPLEEAPPSEEPLPEEATPAEEPVAEELSEEPVAAEAVAEPVEEEAPPPFQASLIVEKGPAQGTAFMLAHLENRVGGSGAQIELGEDPYLAPHAATVAFAEDHLVVRDEGSANGVFVKVRDSAPLGPGDFFVAGERLFRYDGPTDLPKNGEGDTPFLGAPRPAGNAVRVSEILAGGKTGRTCNRAGPVIAIGRTGCDMNFPSDALMAAKHAEVRISEDGTATLVDLGAGPSGVFVRVRAQSQHDLQGGDIVMVGDQILRVEVG